MLNLRSLILLGIALVLALASVFVAQQVLERKAAPPQEAASEPVVVAAVDISRLSKIRQEDVKVVQFPTAALQKDPSLPLGGRAYFSSAAEVVGKFVTQTVYRDEPLVRPRLRDNLGGSALAQVVPPGMRAISVRVNDVTGVGGFVLPDNWVDILAARKLPDSDKTVIDVILQNVKVLAVDQEVGHDKDKPILVKTVTVEVNPQDAIRLIQSSEGGTLQMVLRNPTDKMPIVATATTPAAMHESEKAAKPVPPHPPVHLGEVRIVGLGSNAKRYRCTQAGCVPETPEIVAKEQVQLPQLFNALVPGLSSMIPKGAGDEADAP